jgi:hypothetical protein
MVLACMALGISFSSPAQGTQYGALGRARVLYEDIVAQGLDEYADEADHFVECGSAAVPFLERMVLSKSAAVRNVGFRAIDEVKPPSLTSVLLKLVDRKDTRIDAIYSLGRIGEPSVIPGLRRRLETPADEEEKWALVAALTMLGDETVVGSMIAMAERAKYVYYPDCFTESEPKYEGPESHQVVEALELTTPEIRWTVLRHMLDNWNPTFRKNGISLARTDKSERVREKLFKLLFHRDPRLRIDQDLIDPGVVETLAELGDPRISAITRKHMMESKAFISPTTLIRVLVADGTSESADVVLHWLRYIPKGEYNRHLDLLKQAKEPRLVDVLEKELWTLNDRHPDSVIISFGSQPTVGPLVLNWYQETKELSMIEMANRPFFYERLGLASKYVHMVSDESTDVRREVAEGLATFSFSVAREPLSKLVHDSDEEVRNAAKRALRTFGVVL